MAFTKKLRHELLNMRIEAYKLKLSSPDIAVINAMSAVVEFADKARNHESLFYADLARKNYELGISIVKDKEK